MAIKILDGSELKARTIACVIYGPPAIGKTSLALTASKPILFDFDENAFKASNRGGKAIVPIESWRDMESLTEDDVRPFDTIIVDTVGTCLDKLAADIIASDTRKGVAGALTLNGYGVLKSRFKSWLSSIQSYGKDVVMIAHGAEESRGEEVVDRIVAAGASRQEVYQQATIMGRFFPTAQGRVLSFNPTATSFGKNVGLSDYTVLEPARNPDLMARILSDAKRSINDQADRDDAEHRRLQELRKHIEDMPATPDAFNDLARKMTESNAKPSDRKILLERAQERGVEFDREKKLFIAPPSVTEEPQSEPSQEEAVF